MVFVEEDNFFSLLFKVQRKGKTSKKNRIVYTTKSTPDLKMKYITLISAVFGLLLMESCAPLSKTQIKLTHHYFETITNYPNYYRELNSSIANLQLEASNLESSLQTSDSIRVAWLIESINSYEKALKLPDSILMDIRYVEGYIQDYYLLLPNGFNIYQALKGTTETITGIFGLGGVAHAILPKDVPGLNPTKKRKIKSHLYNSETALIRSLTDIKRYVDEVYIPELEKIDNSSIADFESLLNTISERTDPIIYYTQHNRMLTEFYRKLFLTKNLARNLSTSIEPFINAEQVLTTQLMEWKKIDPETQHLSILIRNIQRIQSILIDLDNESKN